MQGEIHAVIRKLEKLVRISKAMADTGKEQSVPERLFYFLLHKKKYWIRENFPHLIFDRLACFEMDWAQYDHF